jgi:DNA-binding MarR family transcriptional regulator
MSTKRPLADDVGFLLSRASGMVARAASDVLAPFGLRVRSYSVLGFVSDTPRGLTQRRVAAAMGLDPSQIVALVDDLEERELVSRTTDSADRRNKLIVATDEGRRIRNEAEKRVEQSHRRCLAQMSRGEMDSLKGILRGIAFADGVPVEVAPAGRR